MKTIYATTYPGRSAPDSAGAADCPHEVAASGPESESTRLLRELSILEDDLGGALTELFRQLAPLLPTGFFDIDIDSAIADGAEPLPRTELGRRLHGMLEFRRSLIRSVRRVVSSIDIPVGPF